MDKLLEACIEQRFPEQLRGFELAKKRYLPLYAAVYSGMSPNELPENLTTREREVALLAAEGLRSGEIVEKLMVTENTVRFYLHTVFQKLNIDRWAMLAEKLK